VVDDDKDTTESMALLLRGFGFQVQVAADGQAALEEARAGQPDVVLLDIALPHMDGYEVARRLRGQEAGKRPWLVAVTGFGNEKDFRRSQEAGIDFHLVKPVEPARLKGLLEELQTGGAN
jgi:CheY-like chemotaxis protein